MIEEAYKALPPYFYNFLKINLKTKSEFYATKTKYLGLIISTNGITMDPKKVQALQK